MKQLFLNAILLVSSLIAACGMIYAQDNEAGKITLDNQHQNAYMRGVKPLGVNLSADFKSKHIWNGLVSYDAWNLQPNIRFNAYGFFVNAWACIPFTQLHNSEVDLGVGYSWGPVSIQYTEIYYPCPTGQKRNRPDFFSMWREDGSPVHQHYATFHFDGVKKFPIQFDFGIFILGDAVLDVDKDGNTYHREQYSMYLGLGYTHTLKTGQILSYHIGGSPYKGFFTPDKMNIINVKFSITQKFKISESYVIPVTGDLIFNPCYEKLYFVLGIGIF